MEKFKEDVEKAVQECAKSVKPFNEILKEVQMDKALQDLVKPAAQLPEGLTLVSDLISSMIVASIRFQTDLMKATIIKLKTDGVL